MSTTWAPHIRATREPMQPVPMKVGDKVTFFGEKRPYTVRAWSERFVILTKPFNLQHTVLYCVIDWQEGVRGPDNYYGLGYETQEEIDTNLALFNRIDPDDSGIHPEVSHRHAVRININAVNGVSLSRDVRPDITNHQKEGKP